jgi:hypothetical protein
LVFRVSAFGCVSYFVFRFGAVIAPARDRGPGGRRAPFFDVDRIFKERAEFDPPSN